jgi:hypothetical protein
MSALRSEIHPPQLWTGSIFSMGQIECERQTTETAIPIGGGSESKGGLAMERAKNRPDI